MSQFKIGQTVETNAHQQGLVQYVGPIHVAEGDWLGIELPKPEGKNDGSLRGERYFSCPPFHGLFTKESNILTIIAQPAPKPAPTPVPSTSTTKALAKPKLSTVAKPRPSSVMAPKPAPRTSIIAKRQSVAPIQSNAALRAPARKASIAGLPSNVNTEHNVKPAQSTTPRTSAAASTTSATSTVKTQRDGNLETLLTKIRHLEKNHNDDQEQLKELSQVKDERDRFKAILQKIQTKYQVLHQDFADQKTVSQDLQTQMDQMSRSQQEHEIDLEDALIDKEMAEERADQVEAEVDSLRSKLEEKEMELEILREEAELFKADMTPEERQNAGYYQVQHDNERLRQALVVLKEMTEEKERDNKARFLELEADVASLEALRQENIELKEQIHNTSSIVEHLRAQVDASAEWEDVSMELTAKNQELEDRVSTQEVVIRDLESIRELNEELELQHAEQEDDLLKDLEAKDIEIAEQRRQIEAQVVQLAEDKTLISKFRDLVMDLQMRADAADLSKTMTEAQVKDTTGRFNEVMDLNRQLRAASVQDTKRKIDLGLSELKAEEASEALQILKQTESGEFQNSEALQAYFTSKRIFSKSKLLGQVVQDWDSHMDVGGRLDDTISRTHCMDTVNHLYNIRVGSRNFWAVIAASPLPQFNKFGPSYPELITVERTIDQGLDVMKNDEVNYAELAGSLERSTKIHEAVLTNYQEALSARPADETIARVYMIHNKYQRIGCTLDVVRYAMKRAGDDIFEPCQEAKDHLTELTETVKGVLAICNKLGMTLQALRNDSMYPEFPTSLPNIIAMESSIGRSSQAIAQLGRKIIDEVLSYSTLQERSSSLDKEAECTAFTAKLRQLMDEMNDLYHESHAPTMGAMIRSWIEHASVLMNNIEIEEGPTPWLQKAKQAEAARKKNAEASVLLENLKAEHLTTHMSLLERERVIETKSLEVEHLEAKYRDATNKVNDTQQLRDKVAVAEQEAMGLREQVTVLQKNIKSLEEHVDRSDRSDLKRQSSDASKITTAAVEQKAVAQALPAQLETMLSALQMENHWLRRREHTDMFERNLKHVFTRLRQDQRIKRIQAGEVELLDVWYDDEDDEVYPIKPRNPSTFFKEIPAPPTVPAVQSTDSKDSSETPAPNTTEPRLKMPPLALEQAQTSSQATFENYAAQWADYVFFRDSDLSTIGEESDEDASSLFDTLSEMDDDVAYLDDFSRVNHSVTLSSISHADDTLGLEGFSAVKNTLGLEGFSEVAV
jgi:dynactin 1